MINYLNDLYATLDAVFVRNKFDKVILKNHYKFKIVVFFTLHVNQLYSLARIKCFG